jgi:hypothetical protein
MTDRKHLLEHLLDPNQVVVFDGAMGTMLYSKIELIVVLVDEHALRVQHRAHRAVEDDYLIGIEKVLQQVLAIGHLINCWISSVRIAPVYASCGCAATLVASSSRPFFRTLEFQLEKMPIVA